MSSPSFTGQNLTKSFLSFGGVSRFLPKRGWSVPALSQNNSAEYECELAGNSTQNLNWLDQNAQERHFIFSDSKEDADKEGRQKAQSKTKKILCYGAITAFVFNENENPAVRVDFKADPNKYAKAVDNHLTVLKKKYCQTGAGLTFVQLEGNPVYGGPIGLIKKKFKIFDRLYGFWMKISSYNPFTTFSDPGQDLAGNTYNLLFLRKRKSHQSRAEQQSGIQEDRPAGRAHQSMVPDCSQTFNLNMTVRKKWTQPLPNWAPLSSNELSWGQQGSNSPQQQNTHRNSFSIESLLLPVSGASGDQDTLPHPFSLSTFASLAPSLKMEQAVDLSIII
ncbi:hypothetical protein SERLA73DRAFT_156506 [Serpula lacrymans var. lacrymans S7.3]|uniref:Uncharacterized protein n=1 Tax=Serpula lacrymans var. lacrymans (strain S7.3) TaxID=936435 RepID=F8QES2_SERL3|nr:hypothetical protein SERLA73DRAFT_156506 [Serpula lacrymans var. lacrymans S7.3]